MPIRAVLWDIDDTLFDYTGADAAGLAAQLEAVRLAERYGTPAQALARWREITDRHWARFAAGVGTFQGQRQERVREFLERPGMTDDETDAWFDSYVEHYKAAWTVFPDVVPALDALATDYRHGVLSNSSTANQDPSCVTSACANASRCWSAPSSWGSASPRRGRSSPPARRSDCRPGTWRTWGTSPRSTPAAPATPGCSPSGSTGTAAGGPVPRGRTGSKALTGCPSCWRGIPVLEHGQASGNVLSAPPERAERPDGGATRKKGPQGVDFRWGIV